MPPSRLVADLLPCIPLWARTVLDVGCGDGSLAAAFRPFSPATRFLGLADDWRAVRDAEARMDEVSTADIEAEPMPFDVPDGIDCTIYRGLLERLHDPWGLIREHAKALTPDGVMLVCLPNVEHWRMAERLLRGTQDLNAPEYPVGGWFSAPMILRQFARAGLTVCDIQEHVEDRDAAVLFARSIGSALDDLGIDPVGYLRRSAPSHMIWRVRKEPRRRIVLAGSMLEPVGGVSHVRVLHPLQAVASDPAFRTEVRYFVNVGTPTDGEPRIFILHRPALLGAQGYDILRRLADAGYVIVTEFDDHPDHFRMMQMGGELTFRGVHAVQTSTAALADVLRKYNPEVAVFPNALISLPEVRNFADPDCLTLFFGALNREIDWRPLMPVLNEIAAMAGPRLRFQVVHDQGFFDLLDSPFKRFTPTCDYETYMHILGGCEISLMPLGDNSFNRCKSDLKFIEAGACRIAALSSTVVYGDSIHDGQNGLLFRDPEEFRNKLLRLLAVPNEARRLGEAARAYVERERMLAYQVSARIAWYRSLWQRRELLGELMRQRVARPMQQAA